MVVGTNFRVIVQQFPFYCFCVYCHLPLRFHASGLVLYVASVPLSCYYRSIGSAHCERRLLFDPYCTCTCTLLQCHYSAIKHIRSPKQCQGVSNTTSEHVLTTAAPLQKVHVHIHASAIVWLLQLPIWSMWTERSQFLLTLWGP